MLPFLIGAAASVILSEFTKKDKMANGGDIDSKRKMFLHDAVLYNGDLLYITNKNGVLGLANLKRGAWGSDYPFIPISEVNMDDVTDMMGRKISIEEYAKGGGVEIKRYKVFIYYGGEMKDKIIYAKTIEEAKKLAQQGEHADIIDTKTDKMIEMAIGGLVPTAPNGEEFAEGGSVKQVDLFEHFDNMPKKLSSIVNKYMETEDYQDTEAFLNEVESIGYTFDYGLDNEPFGLRPIGVKLNQIEGYEEYKKGGKMNRKKK